MAVKNWLIASTIAFLASGIHAAAQQPMSAIDWLDENTPTDAALTPNEPPTTHSATQPVISVVPLENAAKSAVGLVPRNVTGLPTTLWNGSDPATIARLITDLPVEELPAMQDLLYKLLLAEADQNPNADDAQTLLLARIDKLIVLGALDPAQALIEQADPESSGAMFARWFDVTLLTGDEYRACQTLRRAPHLAPSYSARVFCAVRAGDWQNAALMLDAGRALQLIDTHEAALLDRFLDVEAFEGTPPLAAPDTVTPLIFRLHESIGQALRASSLPRTFASADLRDLAGWKSQLEAAERLTRSGALPANRLLGIYTARLPAASGGIWDRVEALQRFDTALKSASPGAVNKTLPAAWRAMQSAQLDVSFAQLFASDLIGLPLTGAAKNIAYKVALLSPEYEIAANTLGFSNPDAVFLSGLAKGNLGGLTPPDPLSIAIADGFGAAHVPKNIADLTAAGQIGEAILRTMALFDQGTRGDLNSLTQSLAALRALGLEDTARRASLQLLLRNPDT